VPAGLRVHNFAVGRYSVRALRPRRALPGLRARVAPENAERPGLPAAGPRYVVERWSDESHQDADGSPTEQALWSRVRPFIWRPPSGARGWGCALADSPNDNSTFSPLVSGVPGAAFAQVKVVGRSLPLPGLQRRSASVASRGCRSLGSRGCSSG
jgi:hypothetical protein